MKRIPLSALLAALEYGTRLHICVVFCKHYGNDDTALPREHTIHDMPFCQHMKVTAGLDWCYRCRNKALEKAIEERRPFAGYCVNGVYEYCHPVLYKGDVAAVIFVGNILRKAPTALQKPYLDTFEHTPPDGHGETLCAIIDAHIQALLENPPQQDGAPLITNVCNYIEEGLCGDISVRQIASAFNYNESYIGRLFKRHTGTTIREYINRRRLERAREQLRTEQEPITVIAAGCGFNNVTYFNRLFKSAYGVPPTTYRKKRP